MNRYFSKEQTQMVNKHMERRLTPRLTGEMQTQTTVSYHFTPTRAAVRRQTKTNCTKYAKRLKVSVSKKHIELNRKNISKKWAKDCCFQIKKSMWLVNIYKYFNFT